MSDEMKQGKYEPGAGGHFGWCPVCGRQDGYIWLTGRGSEWCFCDAHRVRWCIGEMFGDVRDAATAERVATYREVDGDEPTLEMLAGTEPFPDELTRIYDLPSPPKEAR